MIYDGSLLLLYLKIKDRYAIIGGMRTIKFILNNQLIDSSNISSGIWRELANGGGFKHIDITLIGDFTDNEAEQNIRALAFSGELAEYQLSFANDETLTGKFQITYYERIGEVSEIEQYAIGFASSGEIRYF
jgi:predicted secreted protein